MQGKVSLKKQKVRGKVSSGSNCGWTGPDKGEKNCPEEAESDCIGKQWSAGAERQCENEGGGSSGPQGGQGWGNNKKGGICHARRRK